MEAAVENEVLADSSLEPDDWFTSLRFQWIFSGRFFIYCIQHRGMGFRKACLVNYNVFLFGMYLAGSHCFLFHVIINALLHSNWVIRGFQNPFYMMTWNIHFTFFILGNFLTNHIEVLIPP